MCCDTILVYAWKNRRIVVLRQTDRQRHARYRRTDSLVAFSVKGFHWSIARAIYCTHACIPECCLHRWWTCRDTLQSQYLLRSKNLRDKSCMCHHLRSSQVGRCTPQPKKKRRACLVSAYLHTCMLRICSCGKL
jgi:hypothetical protein